MITKYSNYCIVCGKPNARVHHLCFNFANRKLSDEDGLTMPLCDRHHNMGGLEAVHNNGTLEVFSKIIGQLWFMLLDTTTETQREQSIERFRSRYGKSYI